MLKQKGFSSILTLIIVSLVGFGSQLGLVTQKAIEAKIPPIIRPASSSASLTQESIKENPKKKEEKVSVESNKPNSEGNAKQNPESGKDGYSSSQTQDTVTITGRFTIPDRNRVWYTFSIPKNGGEIKGSTTGACVGSVTGQTQPQNADDEGNFTAQFSAKCTPMPGMSWKIGMKANLEGTVDFKSGKIMLIYIFSEPYSFRGATDIYFTP